MSKKKIYISLPITGRDFDEVESEILYVSGVLEREGYHVVTPIDFDVNPDLDKPYHELLGNDIKALMECDDICLCPGWEKSKGCQLEHFAAKLWDKEIMEFEKLKNKEDMEEKKLNLKEFDLEAAKAGKPVCTRDGRKARIICFDLNNKNFPIVAIINCDTEENAYQYDIDGVCDEHDNNLNLMMSTEKKEGWIIIHKEAIYDKETAEKIARETTANVIRIQKIEWEE